VEKVKVDVLEENHSNNKEKIDLSELKVSPINCNLEYYYNYISYRLYIGLGFKLVLDEGDREGIPELVISHLD
jgi:hypothetical protein